MNTFLKKSVISLLVLVHGFAATAAIAASEAKIVAWEALQPPPVIEDNPFDRLSDEQRDVMRQIALGQLMEERGIAPKTASGQSLRALKAKLHAQGLDADALLAQRKVIAEQRRNAAESGVPALEGQQVLLTGYLVPAVPDGNPSTEFLLVPWVGACSHTAPAPPNQTVRIHTPQPLALQKAYQAAQVQGPLQLKKQAIDVFAVDGSLRMHAVYAMEASAIAVSPARLTAP
jgi:hypothetical protein